MEIGNCFGGKMIRRKVKNHSRTKDSQEDDNGRKTWMEYSEDLYNVDTDQFILYYVVF